MTFARPLTGLLLALLLATLTAAAARAEEKAQGAQEKPVIPGGELQIVGKDGQVKGNCPLKHTDVQADVAGFLGRVKVKQVFHNPTQEKVEAIYVFPLPNDAAVDDMVMTVGERRVVGQVKKREEARRVYEQARASGHVAALLDQERPNIFTQSVANIEPGAQVTIEIGYNQVLKYEDGAFEFVFPTVVAPRYVPGVPTGSQAGSGQVPDTTKVPDASRITPPLTPPNTRAGHDIGLRVRIDAGMKIQEIDSRSHGVEIQRDGDSRATVALKNQQSIPNKDFVLRYRTATDKIGNAFLTHKDERGSFFTLILQPPQRTPREKAVGRELVFVLDTSGSMSGYPVTQAKWVIDEAIRLLGPQDTFNIITFAGDTNILWDQPRPATAENRKEASSFVLSRKGSGGTEMMKAIEAALVKTASKDDSSRIRVVLFLTDGEVGNDFAIIDAVKNNAKTTRVFSFGIGNSVNRFLLDGIAWAGRGDVQYVQLESIAEAAAKKFYERVDAPVLTDIAIDWGELPVAADDVYPQAIPDLWSAKPLVLQGRLKGDPKNWKGQITLRGNTAAGNFERKIDVTPAEAAPSHAALASIWARAKVADLMNQDMAALQRGDLPAPLNEAITNLGIEFRLMTQFTSFVAVEEMTITKGGKPVKVAVPTDLPDGMTYEGLTGENFDLVVEQRLEQLRAMPQQQAGQQGQGRAYYRSRLPISKFDQRGGGGAGSGAAPAPAPAPAPTPAPGDPQPALTPAIQELEKILPTTQPSAAAAMVPPAIKLSPALAALADRVTREGKDGTLAVAGGVKVTAWKVEVLVMLTDPPTKELREALAKLGFEETAQVSNPRVLAGSIDVRKLAELAKLTGVSRIDPMP